MKRILIIDDDEEFCLELRDFLEHRGYQVVYATRGSDAVDLDRNFGANAALDRKSTRLSSSHVSESRMPSSA